MSRRRPLLLLLLLGVATAWPTFAAAQATTGRAATSCLRCHRDPDAIGEDAAALVGDWGRSVHAEVGVGCHDCHGGNPDPPLADDMDAAMDPAWEPNPYLGAPGATTVPAFCGECHADPAFMRRFVPDPRIDQLQEYWTSGHGQALREGDTAVATCVTCHGSHLVLRPDDNESPVYPSRLAATCAACHADPGIMQGRGLPLDQYVRWRRSVHATALLDREDLFAPTCNDCHGNHGATPPGVESIAFVCGQCHGRESELFRASGKYEAYLAHDEYLASADGSCAACHDEPAATFGPIDTFSECSTCHGNHAIVTPRIASLHPLPRTPCFFCHEVTDDGTAELREVSEHYQQVQARLLAQAGERTGERLYNWMVDQALQLEFHTEPTEEEAGRRLRAHFARLFTKFRIGKTTYTFDHPVTGEPVVEAIVRCIHCHAEDPEMTEAAGWPVGRIFMDQMGELMALTARAERLMLAAERGGVSVGDAAIEIDRAVDAQIELEVLVHTFAAGEGTRFDEKYRAGIEHARAALAASHAANEELRYRRDGLKVSLVLILLVLVALALWIRRGSRSVPAEP
ncbi:MAG: cytochrome c3 family protein [Candidatus Krumholzibacteriia bacterium]